MPRTFVDNVLLTLYAIAAVSGGLGGAAAAAWYATHDRRPKVAVIAAYIILGIVFGVVTLGLALFLNHEPPDLNALLLETIAGGAAGAIALASANFTAQVVFRKLGIEVQITMRRNHEGRRSEDLHDEDHEHENTEN